MKNHNLKIICTISLLLLASVTQAASDVYISAPIFPKVDVLYTYEADNYPKEETEKLNVVDTAFMSFDNLFELCLEDDNFSKLLHTASDDEALTQAELAENYNTIASCAYENFSSKPYFIPKLVEDVDMCARILNKNEGQWRMITDTDISNWNEEFYASLSGIINTALPEEGNTNAFGAFYFSVATYVWRHRNQQ